MTTTVQVEREKWVLTRSIHLGYVKDTFGPGTVLEYEPDTRTLFVDGRRCDTAKDLDVLKKQAKMNPKAPFIVPYTEGVVQEVESKDKEEMKQRAPIPEKKIPPKMEVVVSDQDNMPDPIDIKYTQVSKIKNGQVIEERERKKNPNEKMEVIRGDETAAERVKRINASKIDEEEARIEEKANTIPKMEIVRDDSLGAAASSKSSSLNAGAVKHKSAEEIDKIRQENIAKIQEKQHKSVAGIMPVELEEKHGQLVPAKKSPIEALEEEATSIVRVPVTPENLMKRSAVA